MARLLKTSYFPEIPASASLENRLVAYDQRDAALQELMKNKTVVWFPWADGYAYYLVKKTKPLTLQWINSGDCWQVPAAWIRGLRKEDL